ncbi:MAG TPA: glycosyltransferase family 4 protein [Vicinamibacterales bacterium]|nr:glycosyltransferase family 4 protein [Vicinamibacterales bacterium]
MRLLYLTAGAADMYCGSCLRDNALASALLARGHDVVLAPVYTPTLTDERNVSRRKVSFGGISVYLEQYVPLFRRTPWLFDKLWDWAPMLRFASKRQIKVDPALLGGMTVSMLRGAGGYQAKEVDKLVHWLRAEPAFDVINLPFTLLIGLAKPLRDALGVPIVCTMQGEDLFLENLPEPWKSESLELIRRQIDHVDLFLPVSQYYTGFMGRYLGIPASKMKVVPLGISLGGYEPSPRPVGRDFSPGDSKTVGFFGRIAPEKGLHVLVEAFHLLKQKTVMPLRLVAGGYLGPEHKDYFAGVRRRIAELGLGGDFTYAGSPDRAGKQKLLRSFDVMSMPATYDEPKGLTLLEAMAGGVPVVQPARGSFTEILNNTGGGLLVPPDDVEALAQGLLRVLTDPALAEELSRRGAIGVRAHYSVDVMTDAAEAAYGTLRTAARH